MSLTQREFSSLLIAKKLFKDAGQIDLDEKWTRELVAINSSDIFLLDFSRGRRIELTKFTYNKRYRQSIILLRYDSAGRHTNPDDVAFSGPHIHIYKEGFGDKFAHPISSIGLDESDGMNSATVLDKFLDFCNVENKPSIQDIMI